MAEYFVIALYAIRGYRILAHREEMGPKRNKLGEIDLIVQKNDVISFIEIKYRRHLENLYESGLLADNQKCRLHNSISTIIAKINTRLPGNYIYHFHFLHVTKWGKYKYIQTTLDNTIQ